MGDTLKAPKANATTTGRGFPDTLSAYLRASGYGPGTDRAAAQLPLSDYSEAHRDALTPQTIALNWRANVSDRAHALREALWSAEHGGTAGSPAQIERTARALLRALGED